jgi:lipase chaperone LimK
MIGQTRVRIVTVLLVALAFACEAEPENQALVESPRSLTDTRIDGGFSFAADGELVLDQSAQQAFDYFLTADGELSPDELEAWVSEQLRTLIADDEAHAQVMQAWVAYLRFRSEVAEVLEDRALLGQPELIERRLLAALDEQLGGTPLAAVERRRIERGLDLHRALGLTDSDARTAELTRLEAEEARRFAESRAGRYLAGRRAVEQARQSGADAESLAALRVHHFDAIEPGAAERLAALDAKRAAWAGRVSEFQAASERLRASFDGSAAELELAIAQLEAEHFDASERRRLRALRTRD